MSKIVTSVNKRTGLAMVYIQDIMDIRKEESLRKLLGVINIFGVNDLLVNCSCFVEEASFFLVEASALGEGVGISICVSTQQSIINKIKKWLGYNVLFKASINIQGTYLEAVIILAAKYGTTLEVDCYAGNDTVPCLSMGINDIDGSTLHFRTNMYDYFETISKINSIVS